MTDADEDRPQHRAASSVNALRASAVIGLFLVALILLLGPASNGAPGDGSVTTTTTLRLPIIDKATTQLQVANGTDTQGAATQITTKLLNDHWLPKKPVDATTHPAHTYVYFAPGWRRAANDIAGLIGVEQKYVTPLTKFLGVSDAASDDVIVVIGPGLKL
jgi:hypothetical protein